MTLIRSVSGVRGTTGVEITEELVARYARAFASMVGGRVALGCDGRRGGGPLVAAASDGLMRGGALVLDAGVVPTPTVGIAVRERELDGGVVITASHNPETQNGMKFFSSRGVFLDRAEARDLFAVADGAPPDASNGPRETRLLADAVRDHIGLILSCRHVDVERVRKWAPTVVVDCVNGAGSVALPLLLEELGCEVVRLSCEAGAGFPREPEPVPANLGGLGEAVVREAADLGFACDPDADRLAVVDEKGRPIG
ncbi:MAG: phosphoglucosamine mutase, partial [Candidatus Eisenbacteria bacterium]|nr:phosphoglucosamine mutase [Candidatus Eisenbacteria bacterium]